MAESLGATKKTMRTTIDHDREPGRGDTSRHPFPPFRAKAKTPQEIEEKFPVDVVIGFFMQDSSRPMLAQN